MIKTTYDLVKYLNFDKSQRVFTIVQSYVKVILKLGSKEDAQVLLDSYLKDPFHLDYQTLLPIFKKFGDKDLATQIFNQLFIDNQLIDGADPAVLELLGALQYEQVKPLLAQYAFADSSNDYQIQASSALGLLFFDCREYVQQIRSSIERCYGKNLFPEFIPSLVCKLPDKTEYLNHLYELGEKHASTDCNAGIFLGFSLCGPTGKHFFKKALFNPAWEAHSSATGTVHFIYKGMKNLGLSFTELYHHIKTISCETEKSYGLTLLFSLFDQRVLDYEEDNIESFESLYTTFYAWENSNDSDNLIGLAGKVGKEEDAYIYERLFLIRLTEEKIVQNLM